MGLDAQRALSEQGYVNEIIRLARAVVVSTEGHLHDADPDVVAELEEALERLDGATDE